MLPMRWVVLCIAVVLVAGCSGKDAGANKVRLGDGSRISLDLPEDQRPDKDDIRGVVSGVVVNDAIYPIPAAHVQAKGWNFSAETDEDGRFVLESLPPGLFVLEVAKEGHAVGLGTINVKSGEVTKAVLLMSRLPYIAPYHQTVIFDEFNSLTDIENRDHVLGLDASLKTLILEAKWDPLTGVNANVLTYTVAPERSEEPPLQGSGPNPLRVVFDSDAFPPNEYAVRVDVRPTTVAVPAESSGRIFATAFYIDPAPDGWSFVGGDT